jgi:protocatechuate 3,4-dioxygenase beta subunit
MENDDRLIGRILSRREALAVLSATGAAVLVGCAPGSSEPEPATTGPTQAVSSTETEAATAQAAVDTLPTCVVRPEMTEGPYFVDEQLNRSDIRSDPADGSVKEGAQLALTFRVSEVSDTACTPLEGVFVDIWHCDGLGVYSDAQDQGFNTVGQQFLRGYQLTDANGSARFTTIYPGWYFSRAVHIHFKIRSELNSNSSYEFTSQLFFDDVLSDQVYAEEPYASKGERTIRNADDGIFQAGGSQLLLEVSQSGLGYAATFDIGLDTTTSS